MRLSDPREESGSLNLCQLLGLLPCGWPTGRSVSFGFSGVAVLIGDVSGGRGDESTGVSLLRLHQLGPSNLVDTPTSGDPIDSSSPEASRWLRRFVARRSLSLSPFVEVYLSKPIWLLPAINWPPYMGIYIYTARDNIAAINLVAQRIGHQTRDLVPLPVSGSPPLFSHSRLSDIQ